MAAALKAATVKQVVVTSSGAAVVWQKAITHPQGADYVWNEDDWQEDNTLEIVPYRLSKRLAEHAAFDFVKENSPDGKPCFGLATICPTYIMGPVLTPRLDSESVLFMRRLLDGTVTELSGYAVGFVDVRNVAEAQVNAMTLDLDTPGVKNKHGEARFILSSEETWPQIEIANALRKCPDFKGWPIPEKAPPQTQDIKYSNKRAREFLGIKFTSLEETVAAGCKSLVEKGLVKKSEPV